MKLTGELERVARRIRESVRHAKSRRETQAAMDHIDDNATRRASDQQVATDDNAERAGQRPEHGGES